MYCDSNQGIVNMSIPCNNDIVNNPYNDNQIMLYQWYVNTIVFNVVFIIAVILIIFMLNKELIYNRCYTLVDEYRDEDVRVYHTICYSPYCDICSRYVNEEEDEEVVRNLRHTF